MQQNPLTPGHKFRPEHRHPSRLNITALSVLPAWNNAKMFHRKTQKGCRSKRHMALITAVQGDNWQQISVRQLESLIQIYKWISVHFPIKQYFYSLPAHVEIRKEIDVIWLMCFIVPFPLLWKCFPLPAFFMLFIDFVPCFISNIKVGQKRNFRLCESWRLYRSSFHENSCTSGRWNNNEFYLPKLKQWLFYFYKLWFDLRKISVL